MTTPVMPTLARALTVLIGEHLKKAAKQMGYTHAEHFDGPEFPVTDVLCIPETVAEQIVEKHLMEVLGDTAAEPYFVEKVA